MGFPIRSKKKGHLMKFTAAIIISAAVLFAADAPKVDELEALRIEKAQAEKSSYQQEFAKLSSQIEAIQKDGARIPEMQARQKELQNLWNDRTAAETLMTQELFKKSKLNDKEWKLDLPGRTFTKLATTPPAPAPAPAQAANK